MKPSNNWGKRGRSRFTRRSLLIRDIRAAQTRSRKRGVKVSLAPIKGAEQTAK
jgi:hypothetical protein